MEFEDVIKSQDELRALMGAPVAPPVVEKTLSSLDGLPTLAETMKDAASVPGPVEVLDGLIKDDEENRLY